MPRCTRRFQPPTRLARRIPRIRLTSGGRRHRNIFASIGATPVPSWVSSATHARTPRCQPRRLPTCRCRTPNTGNTPLMSPAWWTPSRWPRGVLARCAPAGTTVTYAGGIFQSMQVGNLNHLPSGGSPWWQLRPMGTWLPMAIDGWAVRQRAISAPHWRAQRVRRADLRRASSGPQAVTSYETHRDLMTYSQSPQPAKFAATRLNSAVWGVPVAELRYRAALLRRLPVTCSKRRTRLRTCRRRAADARSRARNKIDHQPDSAAGEPVLPTRRHVYGADGATGPTRWTLYRRRPSVARLSGRRYGVTVAGYTGGSGRWRLHRELTVTATPRCWSNENRWLC